MKSETIFRVLVAGVLTVAPTLLFLGLWRGLMALRDDDLVNRTMNGEFGPVPNSLLRSGLPGSSKIGRDPTTANRAGTSLRCRICDAENPRYADYCGNCLKKIG
ncbi:hypothetical protein [Haladaptatus pallidirubidus]|uniref:Zinc ribbon domain-containing protein n=1 Tax=Haladaptatus pallidirubidus TaxID=1008152 RepID=A0AAV3ULS2_9EURY|nr:hypothetical protein [Haladaptatus pallidirubidus]